MEADEELVLKARSGDTEAFGILITRHQKTVAGLLLSILHDLDMAEEVAQVAFIKAFKGLRAFEGRSSFKTWVTRIALNAAKSHLRWAKLRRWLSFDAPLGDTEETWEARIREAVAAPEGLEALERKLDLERALSALSPRERQVAALRLEGYALGEVAEILAISEGTVKSTLFDAARKMRRKLS